MTVTLHVDAQAWRAQQRRVLAATPGLVPVAKGNGYGFGLPLLAAQAQELEARTLAVGTVREVAAVRGAFDSDIVVLQPYRPGDAVADALLAEDKVITTVSRAEDLRAITAEGRRPRVLVEVLTSMRRHGVAPDDLPGLADALDGVDFEGWTIHLPMPQAAGGSNAIEAERLARAALEIRRAPVWFSHITERDHERLRASLFADTHVRIGTKLWLGPHAHATAEVLDVHRVSRSDKVGYWQRSLPVDGHIVVVAGGTAHGIGLEAPTSASSIRQRMISVANGSLEAVGLARSPFTIGGSKRWFVEPPHMQSSLVFVPGKRCPVQVGDTVPVELRLTTATVDRILLT